MFLQVSVCPWGDVHGCLGGPAWLLGGHAWLLRGVCVVAPGGACMVALGGCAWLLRGACMVARGHAWLLQGEACMVFSMRYGQWAGGTHPTGMHSCLQIFLLEVSSSLTMSILLKVPFNSRNRKWFQNNYSSTTGPTFLLLIRSTAEYQISHRPLHQGTRKFDVIACISCMQCSFLLT